MIITLNLCGKENVLTMSFDVPGAAQARLRCARHRRVCWQAEGAMCGWGGGAALKCFAGTLPTMRA